MPISSDDISDYANTTQGVSTGVRAWGRVTGTGVVNKFSEEPDNTYFISTENGFEITTESGNHLITQSSDS